MRTYTVLSLLVFVACAGAPPPASESQVRAATEVGAPASAPAQQSPGLAGQALASALGDVLSRLCPPDALEDPAARTRCADALTQDATLRGSMQQAYLRWGAQSPGAGLNLGASNTTLFDPLVWRRLYLSTFAFPGGSRVEQVGERFVARVPVVFRNALDAGEYPYPFWHSQPKWQSYERTQELLIFVEREAVVAVLRSEVQDPARSHVAREWDGRWQWNSARGEEPRVALFGYLFSAGNPHVAPLEVAFRTFSEKQRVAACTTCHNPSNPSKINPLEFFNYPNQALTGRHDLVAVLAKNRMPPSVEGAEPGIADPRYRGELLGLARDFAALGDRALAWENTR